MLARDADLPPLCKYEVSTFLVFTVLELNVSSLADSIFPLQNTKSN